jgi:transcriptional regulator with XRE-family HTH domain
MERMPTRVRTVLSRDAARMNREQVARLGAEVRDARLRRRLTQARLGARVGLSQSAISRAERGLGGGLTLDAWQRIAVALGVSLRFAFQRDPLAETADAGHLAMQELVLRLGRAAGYHGLFELPTRPAEPWRSIDVALRDDARRRAIVAECWNSIGDVGAAARGTARKQAEAQAAAAARWGEGAHRVGSVWVVRATARNRAIAARYPEVFAARFPGSSRAWVDALAHGAEPPAEPGLVWSDPAATRVFAWRRRYGHGP